MLKSLSLLTIVIACISLRAYASFSSLPNVLFATSEGGQSSPQNVFRNLFDGEGYLISFWANWCQPCKEEIRYFAAQQSSSKTQVLLINVDDASDIPEANEFLKSVNWQQKQLFDTGGTWLFANETSGELPVNVLVNQNAQIVGKFKQIGHAEYDSLDTNLKDSAPKSWEFKQFVQIIKDNDSRKTAYLNGTSLGWKSGKLSLYLTYDALFKKNPKNAATSNEKSLEKEDDLGLSWINYAPSSHSNLLVGDSMIHWADGDLISLRHNPEFDQASSLRGGKIKLFNDWGTLVLVSGHAYDRLYRYFPNPTEDISHSTPSEHISGINVSAGNETIDSFKYKAGLSVLSYKQDQDIELGFPSTTQDQRTALELSFGYGGSVVSGHYVIFDDLNPSQDKVDGEIKYIELDSSIFEMEQFRANLKLQHKDILFAPNRTQPATVVEVPFVPLENDNKIVNAIKPTLHMGKDHQIKLQYVQENGVLGGLNEESKHYQNTSTAMYEIHNLGSLLLGQQEYQDKSEINQVKRTEEIAEVALKFAHLGARITYKNWDDLSGISKLIDYRLFYSAKIKSQAALSWLQLYSVELTTVTQNNFYKIESGVDQAQLYSGRVGLSFLDHWRLKVASGQERGGVVCTGAVCTNRPPMNGYNAELEFYKIF